MSIVILSMGMISAHPKQSKLPAVFGRYVLLHRLARGGMGEVFLAKIGEIQGFEKPIVIKKILPDLAKDEEFLQRFVEEAQIAITLAHSNIVPVYEMGLVDEQYFLAMEYVEGRDLREIINRCRERRETLDPDLCLLLIREVANGLAYAHRRTDEDGRPIDLVHCDISPPNVVISYEGEVRIIDFGVAKSAMQRAQANQSVAFGKFGYMSPEQLIRGAAVDRRADIYAAGVLMYELLTGRRLFRFDEGSTYRQVARVVTAGKIDAPSFRNPRLPLALDDLVMRALRTEPGERYQTAEELRDAVQQQLYSMNATISADDLATSMRALFPDEIETSRQLKGMLNSTSVESFQGELQDASTHTVSIALADKWNSGVEVEGHIVEGVSVLFPPGKEAAATTTPSTPAALKSSAPEGTDAGKGPSTRRMGAEEMLAVAVEAPTHTGTVPTVPASSGRGKLALLLVAIVLVMVAAGVGAYHFTRQRLAVNHSDLRVAADDPKEVEPTAVEDPVTVDAPDVEPDAAVETSHPDLIAPTASDLTVSAPSPDMGVDLRVPQETKVVRKTAPPKKRKKRPRWKRRPGPRKVRKVPRKQAVSPAMVQRKFKQARREYQRFTRSYGQQLDSDWQKILFANTYGSMDESKYRRLNAMLDVLRLRMKQIKEKSK